MVLAADVDERSVTLIRDPIVHIHIYPVQSLSRRRAARLGVLACLYWACLYGWSWQLSSLCGNAESFSRLTGERGRHRYCRRLLRFQWRAFSRV